VNFLLMVLQRLVPKISGGDLAVYPLNKPVVGVAAHDLKARFVLFFLADTMPKGRR
jgi:hypothetical protein